MAAKSAYLIAAVLNAALRNVALQVATPYISLHTADPGTTGANEVSGNAYARVAATFAAPSGGAVVNTNVVTFPAPTPANWGTVTNAGVWDALSKGVPPPMRGVMPIPGQPTLTISGVTVDNTNTPVAACTVTLFRSADNTPVQTIVSDGSGNYAFVPVGLGQQYFVRAVDPTGAIVGTSVSSLVGM